MQASVLIAKNEVELRDVPAPVPEDDQVLVRVEAVGVCGSDVHYYREGRIGDFVVTSPLILGHEVGGVIVEVGARVPRERIGQRVAIEPQRACRMCEQCKQGRYNLCPSMEFYATPPIHGAFAELAAIQADYAYEIPETMSMEAAALCEPLSVGIWSAQKAGIGAGSRVLIAGAGPIGIMAAQVARAYGAAEILVSDVAEERLEAALRFGATRVIDARNDDGTAMGLDVDAFIDASGAAPAVHAGILSVKPAGRVVLVGMGTDDAMLPVARIQNRELVLTGVFRYAHTWPVAIALIASGRVDLDAMVTSRFGLDAVQEALEIAGRPESIKAVVLPNG